MSVKNTYEIERTTAIRVLIDKIYSATNQELSEMLEALPESTFRNYNVVNNFFPEDKEEDEFGYPRRINSASEF